MVTQQIFNNVGTVSKIHKGNAIKKSQEKKTAKCQFTTCGYQSPVRQDPISQHLRGRKQNCSLRKLPQGGASEARRPCLQRQIAAPGHPPGMHAHQGRGAAVSRAWGQACSRRSIKQNQGGKSLRVSEAA